MRYFVVLCILFFSDLSHAKESICYGSTQNGRLENGVSLPNKGNNFISYGRFPRIAGRTYVHSRVRAVVLDAYRMLETKQASKIFKYGETGFQKGGKFKPHKTHQNGLSVDFFVPVLDRYGRSTYFPTNPFNKYGYNFEFDENGEHKDYRIDFEALGGHIVFLHKAAKKAGIGIWRVLFAPELQPLLYATPYGPYIKKHINIPKKRSWVRHDEHIHVDFDIPCQAK
jgi:penicillin-insensitive murein DD-endopeptidase